MQRVRDGDEVGIGEGPAHPREQARNRAGVREELRAPQSPRGAAKCEQLLAMVGSEVADYFPPLPLGGMAANPPFSFFAAGFFNILVSSPSTSTTAPVYSERSALTTSMRDARAAGISDAAIAAATSTAAAPTAGRMPGMRTSWM